jgi:hypothetical protein
MPRRARVAGRRSDPRRAQGPALGPDPDPEQAWRTLGMVTASVAHAENKTAATLASAGVAGGVLFSLAHSVQSPQAPAVVAAVSSGLCFFAAGVFASIGLWARSAPRQTPTSHIYFDHIGRQHPRSPKAYVDLLRELTRDEAGLIEQIGAQIWANSFVARRKFRWANYGLGCLLAGLLLLAVTGAMFLAQG